MYTVVENKLIVISFICTASAAKSLKPVNQGSSIHSFEEESCNYAQYSLEKLQSKPAY